MSEDKKTSDLINKIVAQTNLPSNIVEAFVKQLFVEMEKELILSSHLKVDGLGVFRLMKSGTLRKVLFLSKFKSEAPAVAKDNRIEIEKVDLGTKRKPENIKENIISSESTISNEDKEKILKTEPLPEDISTSINDIKPIEEDIIVKPKVQDVHISTEEEKKEAEYIPDNNPAYLDGLVQENDDAFREYEERPIVGTQFDDSFFDEYQDYEDDEKKLSKRKTWLVIGSVVAIVAIVLFFALLPDKIKDPLPPKANINVPTYIELDNPDSLKYKAVIIAENNVDFATLSRDYYESELFWPYIYKANKVDIAAPLEIEAGTTIYIPVVAKKLLDPNSAESIDSVRNLVNEMIKMRSNAVSSSSALEKDSVQ